ncbi:MAG: hypothetical protein JJ879_06890 [Sneathiella sp.]|nr:hypothetical protein [Sneathiella sp.]
MIGGCAGSAAPLPPSISENSPQQVEASLGITSEDKQLSCQELTSQENQLREAVEVNKSVIAGERTRNQVAGYFGALFLIPLVAVENNSDAKENLLRLQTRLDQIQYLQKLNTCTSL